MRNDFWLVMTVVTLFVGSGFVYKYTIAPDRKDAGTMNAIPASTVPIVTEIGRAADDVPPPITRKKPETVTITLEAIAVRGAIADGVEYEYWTYDRTVPGPMLRVREGDTVRVSVFHNPAGHSHTAGFDPRELGISGPFALPVAHADTGHSHETVDAHASSDTPDGAHAHADHSVDLHAVLGPGGGAMLTKAKDGETKTFQFTALRPGIYVYHCASAHIPTHIANGMYGLILVEPKEGLPAVDREFYVMQGEFYTTGKTGEKGLQGLSKEKLLDEHPEYVVFNGRVGSLAGARALKAKTGETVRIYFGVGTFLPSNFHVIGGVLDRLYPEGDIMSPPHQNVQTTLVPAGGAMMTEFDLHVPGKFLLVDHALPRAIDKGAIGELVVEGEARPDIITTISQ